MKPGPGPLRHRWFISAPRCNLAPRQKCSAVLQTSVPGVSENKALLQFVCYEPKYLNSFQWHGWSGFPGTWWRRRVTLSELTSKLAWLFITIPNGSTLMTPTCFPGAVAGKLNSQIQCSVSSYNSKYFKNIECVPHQHSAGLLTINYMLVTSLHIYFFCLDRAALVWKPQSGKVRKYRIFQTVRRSKQ